MKNILAIFIGLFLCISLSVTAQTYKQNDKVQIEYNGSWYPGSILELKDGKYKIHYDGYSDSWNEWITTARLKPAAGANSTSTKVETQKVAAAPDKTPTTTKTTGANEIPLKEVSNDEIGYSLMIPANAKEDKSPAPEVARYYTLNLPDFMSITTQVGKMLGEMSSMDDAIRDATLMGQKSIREKKENGPNFLVIKEPQGVLQEFWYYVKTSGDDYIYVKCSAPVAQAETCKKIVNSLKATK